MLYRSICHQVLNQADKLALLAIILLLADVSPTYSSDLPRGAARIFLRGGVEVMEAKALKRKSCL